MRAFQILWTGPLLQRTWGGCKIEQPIDNIEDIFPDYYLLTIILSVLQWKRLHQGSIKIYSDLKITSYLYKFNLLDLWDEYDVETLTNIDKNIDYSCFYSAGKFFAFLKEPAPCITVDVDLILWKSLDSFISRIEVGFTHWEDTYPPSYWYCPKEKLKAPRDYKFKEIWNWNLMAANTSLVYFQDDKLKNYYSSEVIRYMADNYVGGEFNIIKPELLFIEQRLLPMCIYEMGLMNKTKPFIDAIWSPTAGCFTKDDREIGRWRYYKITEQSFMTHLWIAKGRIEKNRRYRNYYCYQLINYILSIRPELESNLANIDCLKEHFLRYLRKGTSEEELNKADFSYDVRVI